MVQEIDESLFVELETEQLKEKKKLEQKALVFNSGRKPQGQWVKKIVEKIKISELASERGIEKCPKCDYVLQFDDDRGFFICTHAKYSGKKACDFGGNIVAFTEFLMEGGRW